MSLIVNGTEQNSFNVNDTDIDNLYVDDVLVWTSAEDTYPIQISFGDASNTQVPPGVMTINDINDYMETGPWMLVDETGTAIDVQIRILDANAQATETSGVSGNDSWCLSDYQVYNRWKVWNNVDAESVTIEIFFPAGTWKIKIAGCRTDGSDVYASDFTFDGIKLTQDAANNHDCIEWTTTFPSNGWVTLLWENNTDSGSYYGYLNGMTIEQIS